MPSPLKSAFQGRFLEHPLHPILVHLPIGMWAASLVFDILYFSANNPSFASFSYYLILIGLVGAVLASPPGLAEYWDIPKNTKPRRLALAHLVMNVAIVALYTFNLYLRYTQSSGVPTTVTAGPLLLSLVSIALLSVSGYLRGLLVYEYGIGVHQNREPKPEKTKESSHRAA